MSNPTMKIGIPLVTSPMITMVISSEDCSAHDRLTFFTSPLSKTITTKENPTLTGKNDHVISEEPTIQIEVGAPIQINSTTQRPIIADLRVRPERKLIVGFVTCIDGKRRSMIGIELAGYVFRCAELRRKVKQPPRLPLLQLLREWDGRGQYGRCPPHLPQIPWPTLLLQLSERHPNLGYVCPVCGRIQLRQGPLPTLRWHLYNEHERWLGRDVSPL